MVGVGRMGVETGCQCLLQGGVQVLAVHCLIAAFFSDTSHESVRFVLNPGMHLATILGDFGFGGLVCSCCCCCRRGLVATKQSSQSLLFLGFVFRVWDLAGGNLHFLELHVGHLSHGFRRGNDFGGTRGWFIPNPLLGSLVGEIRSNRQFSSQFANRQRLLPRVSVGLGILVTTDMIGTTGYVAIVFLGGLRRLFSPGCHALRLVFVLAHSF